MKYKNTPIIVLVFMIQILIGAAYTAEDDVIIADFESGYATEGLPVKWTSTGDAFGTAPACGTLTNQQPVTGFEGKGLVNSFLDEDKSMGTLTSSEFAISRPYINLLVGGGAYVDLTCVNLVIDSKVVCTATGRCDEGLSWVTWNVSKYQGEKAHVEIIDQTTAGWGHINVDQITLSNNAISAELRTDELYNETYRPQFHFTAKANWLNDPNGLVFYKGEYHLFFQHNPFGVNWGNMHWGHAISTDLVHWTEQPIAIAPDELGTIFSGSAVVDADNTSGLRTGDENVLCAFYTAAGKPFTQCLAFSNDRGRTWIKYSHNPILNNVAGDNRDPKVIWHAPSKKWVMALYLKDNDFALFGSPNLKEWKELSRITIPGSSECPDFYELPVDGDITNTRWVLQGADGNYLIGRFDGERFMPETEKCEADYGKHFYATQSYSNIPLEDGRRIQIAWMNGGTYPAMPFNQQMSFPCVLTLRAFSEGLRICRNPVREIETLRATPHTWQDLAVPTGEPKELSGVKGDLFDINAKIELHSATACGLIVHGEPVRIDKAAHELTCLGAKAPIDIPNGVVTLRILVDRTSIEVYANDGKVSMTSCFLPKDKGLLVAPFAEGGDALLQHLGIYELKSAWTQK